MATTQIYGIVNEVAKQTLGTSAIAAIDTNSFVTLGQQVLSSTDNVENFTNTLVQRIARTITSFRMYNSRLKPLIFDTIRWGAIVQKLKVEMPEAVTDDSYDLTDGASVDMYIVKKPKVKQKFFVNSTPYSFFVTIQGWQLRRAFMSEESMSAFIAAIFGEVQNKLELTFENLGYLTMDNFIANLGGTQVINLVTNFNATHSTTLTSANCMYNNEFLRWSIAQMNLYSTRMESMSTLYNAEGYTRHTPRNLQRFVAICDFMEYMRTVVQYQAFHEQYVTKAASIEIPYWQSAQSPMDITVTNDDGTETTVNNVVGFIHDRDALGTYRKEQKVLTTPVNARGDYTNTFWHEEQMWFNDLSENALVFTLN